MLTKKVANGNLSTTDSFDTKYRIKLPNPPPRNTSNNAFIVCNIHRNFIYYNAYYANSISTANLLLLR